MHATGGATPLMYACQQCRESEVLELLRKQPQSVKDRDRTYKTPLHYCAENPNSSCAEAILKVAPELVNAQDENGYCTLHLAVIAGNKPLIKLLIAKGADVNIHDNEGHSAVHWAIVSSEKEALEMIIRAGANPSTADIHGGYPLHYAVQMCGCNCDHSRNFEDTVRVVETLLNFGVDVSVKDKDGRQPILWAASAGSADAVVHLVSAGACVEAADKDGLTALHCAASRGHTSTLETLISLCGANVDVIDGNGCSALFYSVTLGHADATELLLQLGAEPNRQDRKGRTPAHCGAAKGQLETLRILQKHGGNLWMRNVKGDIPLHEAVASGRKDLVLWLLSQCPEAINIANNDGRCPLHIASMYNNTEMVKVLLDSKSLVNPVMRTSKGVLMTPLNVALSKGHRSCGKYLQLHGGVPFSKVSRVEPASGFALRVSPPDDAVIVTVEKSKENEMTSQIKISKSRSSTDNRDVTDKENRDIVKTETADKKKVYRRRKKKKNPSNTQTQDSDTDEDLKVKTSTHRKTKDEGQDEDEKIKPVKDIKETDSNVKIRTVSTVQTEETVKKTTKAGTESKPLQRTKSFNETKNVSDLSPEDFPPLMQTISHLDIVIMEPDVDIIKPESDRNAESITVTAEENEKEVKTALEGNTAHVEETDVHIDEKEEEKQVKTKEKTVLEGNITQVEVTEKAGEKKQTRADEETVTEGNIPQVEETDINIDEKGGEKKPVRAEEKEVLEGNIVQVETTDISEKVVEKKQTKAKEKAAVEGSTKEIAQVEETDEKPVEKEHERKNGTSPQEKPRKSVGVKKPNGNTRKDEEKSSGWKSSEESSGRKTVKSPKSLSDGDSTKKTRKKTDLEKTEHKKTVSTKETKTTDRTENNSEVDKEKENDKTNNLETKPIDENEKPKTEPETSTEISTKDESQQIVVDAQEAGTPSRDAPTGSEAETNVDTKADSAIHEEETPKENIPPEPEQQKKTEPEEEIKPLETRTIIEEVTTEKEIAAVETETSSSGGNEVNGTESALPAGNVEPEKNIDEPVKIPLSEAVVTEKQISKDPEITQTETKPDGGDLEESVFQKTGSNENLIHLTEKRFAELKESESEKERQQDDENEQTTSEQKDNMEADIILNSKENGGNDETEKTDMTLEEEKTDSQDGSPEKKTNFSGEKQFKTPRVSRLCRRNKDFKDDVNQISVTQLVQNTVRKYHMERGIFYQLLELKRYQIRSGRANEQVLVKRLVDDYERSRVFLGMKPFSGLYKFKEFEKFLYDQLKALNSRRSYIIPEVKSYDDIDALSGFLKKSRYKILSETPPPEMVCTCITQRCHHSACAYTNVPCSAYITDLRRHRHRRPRRESFFPRIEQAQPVRPEKQKERPATLELIQGSEKHVITLPQNSPGMGKRYYVTFTIKGAPAFKDEDYADESKDYFKHRHAKSV